MWLLMMLARKLVIDGPRRSPGALCLIALAAVLARPDALLALGSMAMIGLVIERPDRPGVGSPGSAVPSWLPWPSPLPGRRTSATRCPIPTSPRTWASPGPSARVGRTSSTPFSRKHRSLTGHCVQRSVDPSVPLSRRRDLRHRDAPSEVPISPCHRRGADTVHIEVGRRLDDGKRFVAAAVIPLVILELLGVVKMISFVTRHARRQVAHLTLAFVIFVLIAASAFPFLVLPRTELADPRHRRWVTHKFRELSVLLTDLERPSRRRSLPARRSDGGHERDRLRGIRAAGSPGPGPSRSHQCHHRPGISGIREIPLRSR